MLNISNFLESNSVKCVESGGPFQIIEYERDLSNVIHKATTEYFMSQMNIRPRQIVCSLKDSGVCIQAAAVQWLAGNIQRTAGLKCGGDLMDLTTAEIKAFAIKPQYVGDGILVTEPSHRHFLVEDLANWKGGLVTQDPLFAAAQNTVGMDVVSRGNAPGSAGEGLFDLCFTGNGFVVLESLVARQDLIIIDLVDDQIKIDGTYAIAWSHTLKFSVERSGKIAIDGGEGFFNVFRGTGRILMLPQT